MDRSTPKLRLRDALNGGLLFVLLYALAGCGGAGLKVATPKPGAVEVKLLAAQGVVELRHGGDWVPLQADHPESGVTELRAVGGGAVVALSASGVELGKLYLRGGSTVSLSQ